MRIFIPVLLSLSVLMLSCADKNEERTQNGTCIRGLTPEQVFYELPELGMAISRGWEEDAYRWNLSMKYGGINYWIEISSIDSVTVQHVRAVVVADFSKTNVLNSQQFLRIVAASPYTGSDPDRVEAWITDHYTANRSEIVVGGVKYTLYAPSRFMREMTMSVSLEDASKSLTEMFTE